MGMILYTYNVTFYQPSVGRLTKGGIGLLIHSSNIREVVLELTILPDL